MLVLFRHHDAQHVALITNASGEKVLVCDEDSPEGACKVPAGQVFVMGDNRTNSQDSRADGPVEIASVVVVQRN
jgi:hypothetical protein